MNRTQLIDLSLDINNGKKVTAMTACGKVSVVSHVTSINVYFQSANLNPFGYHYSKVNVLRIEVDGDV